VPQSAVEEDVIENLRIEALPEKQRKLEMKFQKRNRDILKAMPPVSKYDNVGYKYTYPVDLNTFFRVFLCNSPVKHQGKQYTSCWQLFEEVQGVYQIDVQEWSKDLPNDITSKKSLLDYKGSLERFCIGKKKMNISLPFVPKEICFEQHNRLFFVNEKQLVVILEVDSKENYPLKDTFKFRTCYVLTEETGTDGKPVVTMSFNYYVDWYKSTILKPVLLKAASDEIKGTGASIDKIIRNLIENGVFEKKREELEANKQAEISVEEESEESVESGSTLDKDERQVAQEQMLVEPKESVGL